MAASATAPSTGIRFFTMGGELVKKTFDEIGASGKKMWAGIATGQEAARPGMRAMSNAVGELKGGVESMVARAGPAGSVLMGFGAGGVAAAAGIGAVVVALNQASAAMDFASDIGDAAERIHVSTDALQAYRYMVTQTGGSAEEADQALKSFNENFGMARAGNARSLKWFEALGFSKDNLQQVKTGEELLPEVAQRIAQLSSTAEQAGIADKLGLSALLPAIRESNGALDTWIVKARDAGVVMDAGLIKKGKETKDQLAAVSQVVKVQLSQAFLDLAPVLTSVMGLIAKMTKRLGEFVDRFRDIRHQTQQGLWDRRGSLEWEKQQLVKKYGWTELSKPVDRSTESVVPTEFGALTVRDPLNDARQRFADIRKEQSSITSELARRDKEDRLVETPGTKLDIPVDKKTPDKTNDQRRNFDSAMKRAEDAIASAQSMMAATIDERLAIDLRRLDTDRAAEKEDLARQVKNKDLTKAQAAQIEAQQSQAYETKRSATTAAAARERGKLNEKYDVAMQDAQRDELMSLEDLALTAKQRLAIELQVLESERRKQRAELMRSFAPGGANASMTAEQQAGEVSAFDAETARQRGKLVQQAGGDWMQDGRQAVYTSLHDAVRAAFTDNKSFLDSFFEGLAQTFSQKMSDKLADTLFDGLDAGVSALFSGASAGAGKSSGAAGNIASSLWGGVKSLFGFASGGEPSSGVAFRAAEHDTEMMLIGRAGRVFNADDTADLLRGAMSGADNGAGQTTVHAVYSPTYQVTGTAEEITALKREIKKDRASFSTNVRNAVNEGIDRRTIKASK